jgi:hypothetical protein
MVATKLAIPNPARRAKGTLFTPLPDVWAAASVGKIGTGYSVIPYWAHRLQVQFKAVSFLLSKFLQLQYLH